MQLQGRWVIVGMLLIAVLGAAAGWWALQQQSNLVMGYFGRQTVQRLLDAPRIELWQLQPLPETAESATPPPAEASSETLPDWAKSAARGQVRHQDAKSLPGTMNICRGLLSDSTYSGSPVPRGLDDAWQYALQLSDPAGESVVLIDVRSGRVGLVGHDLCLSLNPAVVPGLTEYCQSAFAAKVRSLPAGATNPTGPTGPP